MESTAQVFNQTSCPLYQNVSRVSPSLAEASNDKRDTLTALYKNYYKSLRKIVCRYRLEEVQVEDMLQETFLKAMLNIDSLKDRNAVYPWLCSIAKNLCLLELRKNRRFTSLHTPSPFSHGDDEGSGYELTLKAEDTTASMKLEYSLTVLRGMIENHQHKVRRDVARRFYVEEKSVKDISDECQMNQNTILSHLRRFRGIIADAMLTIAEEQDLMKAVN